MDRKLRITIPEKAKYIINKIQAAGFEEGNTLYEYCLSEIAKTGINVKGGVYGGDMCVEIINDGPVTILLDSKKVF